MTMASSQSGLELNDVQIWERTTYDMSGDLESLYSQCFYVDDNENAFSGSIEVHENDVTLEEVLDCLSPVPDCEIYPQVFTGMVEIKSADLVDWEVFYRKEPRYRSYIQGETTVAKRFLNEAKLLHRIRGNSHPNLEEFKGCTVNRGCIVALVLKKYRTLREVVDAEHFILPAEQSKWMGQLRAAANHLHSLGFAHNDIQVANIRIHENRDAILAGLYSCQLLGKKLPEDTPCFFAEFTKNSSIENDEKGLADFEKWLRDPHGEDTLYGPDDENDEDDGNEVDDGDDIMADA